MVKMKLTVKVCPRSSKEEFVEKDGLIKVYVKAAPTDGKANKAALGVIAKKFKVAKKDVRIVTGKSGRNKIVEVIDL